MPSCKPGTASLSLGRAWEHALFTKLAEASKAGFKGIEIFYEDLGYLASTYNTSATNKDSTGSNTPVADEDLIRTAGEVRNWCLEFGLRVICLQPFMFYEGLVDRGEHAKRIEKLKVWFRLVEILGTDLILIPSNFLPAVDITSDIDAIVRDMLEVADLGARENPPVRFAYENLAWGTYIDTWEQVWSIIQKVDRPNFGFCLDTFNIVGRIWADPAAPSGKTPSADEDLDQSLARLKETIDPQKIFFAQVVDAERMEEPLVEGHPWYQEDQPARMSWSRNARLFAGEEGGYLPILRVLDVLFRDLEYEGWVSMELFSRDMADPDADVPESLARRGIESWRWLNEKYRLE
ncbi:hypothetical protein M409DRAFT_70780 [Zasmidium cellare ATCC 36951]|uniref:Xylose isomerase-like TIM barrel domain-containing protein n=1 Tax=Zasmidium cellare ATCC 36951 TaxID=1080233 RepID=A0A6A6BYN9_ZASCE|nr:uncharacterized protein M409DRAFT_70780 [Zasmidium cellare ATCC 36951]KAF2159901.1 hypothetical protein M409DRAFT_70780 [Zasmidium cellare ATCC 36951]